MGALTEVVTSQYRVKALGSAAKEEWAVGWPIVGEGDSGAGATQCAMPVLGEELTSSTGLEVFPDKAAALSQPLSTNQHDSRYSLFGLHLDVKQRGWTRTVFSNPPGCLCLPIAR